MDSRICLTRADALPRPDGLVLVAAVAFVLGTSLRFGTGLGLPLWIDETFTGAIAAESDLAGLLHQVWADVNAPLYYVVMFGWARVAGLSNMALHLPSAVFATLAVLLAFRGDPGLDRRTCLIWGVLLGLWQPGLAQASEARCYALLLLLATVSTLAFARLLSRPTRDNAWLWAAASALAILTHYYALPVAAAQGLVFLGRHRGDALRTWPALLAFLPAFGWIGYHAARLSAFAHPDIAWYAPLDLWDLLDVGYLLLGTSGIALLIVTFVVRIRSRPAMPADGALAVAGAALLGLAVILLAGMLRPSFSLRYCVPCLPGLLLGLAALVRSGSDARPYLPALALVLFGLPAMIAPAPARGYSFERAASAIAEAGVNRLVFLWDHPSSPIQDPAQMRAVGGFFLERAGRGVTVEAIANPWHEDPNPRLLAAAGTDPQTAILWLYDRDLSKTAALAHPPRIDAADSAWRCRDHAGNRFVALVCLRGANR